MNKLQKPIPQSSCIPRSGKNVIGPFATVRSYEAADENIGWKKLQKYTSNAK